MNTMSSFTDLLVPASLFLAAAEKTAPSGIQLVWDFLATGGFVMALLVLCSMAAIGASILAWLQLREHIIMPKSVISQLRSIPNYALKGDIRPLQGFPIFRIEPTPSRNVRSTERMRNPVDRAYSMS